MKIKSTLGQPSRSLPESVAQKKDDELIIRARRQTKLGHAIGPEHGISLWWFSLTDIETKREIPQAVSRERTAERSPSPDPNSPPPEVVGVYD